MAEDVELCLQVQVDPESKKILSNSHKCRSTLLDVTVIKPKEIEAFGTQRTSTLRADEVCRLLTSLQKRRRRKQKAIDHLKNDDTIVKVYKHQANARCQKNWTHLDLLSSSSLIDDLERKDFIGITESVEPLFCEIRRSLKNVETTITNMQDIKIVVSQTTVNKTVSKNYFSSTNKKQLTPSASFKNQTIYKVETAPENLKPVLLCQTTQKLEQGDEIKGKCLCGNCGTVGHLIECQKHPLLSELSESSPPTEIFYKAKHQRKKKTRFSLDNTKNNITNNWEETTYINQLIERVKVLEKKMLLQEERLVSKDYLKKIMSKIVTNLSLKSFKSKSDESVEHCCKQIDKNKVTSTKSNANTKKTEKATITDDESYYGTYIWKWGEEILRPGIDLKNCVTNLIHQFFEKLSINNKSDKYNSDSIKNFMQYMNTKIFNTRVETKSNFFNKTENDSTYATLSKAVIEESFQKETTKHSTTKNDKNVDTSYVNPKLSLWKKMSPSLSNLPRQSTIAGRQEFLKIVSKAKQCQKDVLWKNIWSQAKVNGQNKNDKITIKIPIENKTHKNDDMVETELTIKEVENILKN